MKYIDEVRIADILGGARSPAPEEIDRILTKSLALQRLTLSEAAALLCVDDPAQAEKILSAAALVKDRIYGRRVVLFAPLYISNRCANACRYCAFQDGNELTRRRSLSVGEIQAQVSWLLQRGHKRILMVSGEDIRSGKAPIDYYVEAIRAIYAARHAAHAVKRVNVNVAPLSVPEFRRLKEAGIGTYQLFQETYHEETYRFVHPRGPKADPDNRIEALDRAFASGIEDVGIGVLYGLYDWRFETVALLMHVEALERRHGVGPHTISVPRIEPAAGVSFNERLACAVSDGDFKRIVAVLRLAVPYTGLILSTREPASLRDELFTLGISQVSAESRTDPGGYGDTAHAGTGQFSLSDTRSLDEVIASLLERGFVPSFCAACYRRQRTGAAFMELARPGTIKGKCSMNALITLKEYLDDFGSPRTREAGYRMIDQLRQGLQAQDRACLEAFFEHIKNGKRDEYV